MGEASVAIVGIVGIASSMAIDAIGASDAIDISMVDGGDVCDGRRRFRGFRSVMPGMV